MSRDIICIVKHHRIFPPIAVDYWKLIFEWIRNPDYCRMFAIPLTAPPMSGPDLSKVRVRATWRVYEDACNGCVQCCIRRSCPLLDAERNSAEATVRFSGAISSAGDIRKTKRKSATMIGLSGKFARDPDISFRRGPDRMGRSDQGSLREGRADNWQILHRLRKLCPRGI